MICDNVVTSPPYVVCQATMVTPTAVPPPESGLISTPKECPGARMNHISGPCTDITSFEMMNCPAISPLSAALTTLLYALMPVGHEMPSPSAVHSTGTSVIPATEGSNRLRSQQRVVALARKPDTTT